MLKFLPLSLFIISFLLPLTVLGQGFEKRMGEPNCYYEGTSTVGLADGDMIVSGAYNCQGGPQNWKSYLARLKPNGDTVWTKKNGKPNGLVKRTDDDNLIFLGGNHASFVYDTIYVSKTNLNGKSLWTKQFTMGPCGNNTAYDIQQTGDKGYIFTGIYAHQNCNSPDFNSFVIKLNKQGQVQWQKTYGMKTGDDQVFQIEEIKNGYAIFGWTENYGADGIDYWLTRIDKSGNILWTETHGGQGNQYGYGMDQTNDQGFILTGHANKMEALKIDSWGKKEWSKQFQKACGGQYFRVHQLNSGGYAFLGSQSINGKCKSALLRTNKNGSVSWRKYWDGRLRNFKRDESGSYLLTGYVSYLPEMHTIKFDTLRSDKPDQPNDTSTNNNSGTPHPYPFDDSMTIDEPISVSDSVIESGYMFQNHGEPVDEPIEDDQTTATKSSSVDVENIEQSSMIYPNPAKEVATLKFANPENKQFTLRLYNVEGQLMRSIGNIRNNKVKIRKLGLSKGNYIYKLKGESGQLYMGKLIFK